MNARSYLLCIFVFCVGVLLGSFANKRYAKRYVSIGDKITVTYPTGDYVTDSEGNLKQKAEKSVNLLIYRKSNEGDFRDRSNLKLWRISTDDLSTVYFASEIDP
jgi:hypothetical protein